MNLVIAIPALRSATAFAACCVVVLLAGCGGGLDRKLDGSSETAYRLSLAKIHQSAKPDETERLDRALLTLAISDVSIGYEGGILGALAKISATPAEQLGGEALQCLLPLVNGRTGYEVIAAGTRRQKEQAEKQLARVDRDIVQLKKAREDKTASQGLLDQIEISAPRLSYTGSGTNRIAMIEFSVHNATETPLAQLGLRGTVTAPDHPQPWISEDINYKLSGVLAPGESKDIRLPNGSPGKWNTPELWAREDRILKIDVVNALTATGASLVASFTHKDEEQLALLEKQRPELQRMLETK